jgi:hypothetical protein
MTVPAAAGTAAVAGALLVLAVVCCSSSDEYATGGRLLVPAMYVFGDSLVDAGNNDFLPPPAPPALPPNGVDLPRWVLHRTGRFTNGFNLADIIGNPLFFFPARCLLVSGFRFTQVNNTTDYTGVACSTASGVQDEPTRRPLASPMDSPSTRPRRRQLRFRRVRHPRRHREYPSMLSSSSLSEQRKIKNRSRLSCLLAGERHDQSARASPAVQEDQGQNRPGRRGGAGRPAGPLPVRRQLRRQ